MAIITLTTDFGLEDHYVAVMKAVILQQAPKVRLVDVTHCVPKFNTAYGAVVLRQIVEWFPAGTVHLVVVDPGVGSERAVLATRYHGQYVICPDNGLITLVHRTYPFEIVRRLNQTGEAPRSRTFHGRDIMAPAAAYLAKGEPIERLGTLAGELELLNMPAPELLPDGTIHGQVVYIDSFGNLVTNIHRTELARALTLRRRPQVFVGDQLVGPLATCYADVAPGNGLGLVGSSDMLEVSVHRGSAAETYKAAPGHAVTVK